LENERDVKWCGECGKWGSHFRAQHKTDNGGDGNADGAEANAAGNNATVVSETPDEIMGATVGSTTGVDNDLMVNASGNVS